MHDVVGLGASQYTWTQSRGVPVLLGSTVLMIGGQPTAFLGAPAVHADDRSSPISARTLLTTETQMMCFGFPAGTMATLDGVTAACDSGVFVMPVPSAWNRRVSDVRIVHPPATPPGTYRSWSNNAAWQGVTDAGMDVSMMGPECMAGGISTSSSSTGERRYPFATWARRARSAWRSTCKARHRCAWSCRPTTRRRRRRDRSR
jgi:uncharacterized Zn-binding protein involved in type VI secretion